MLHFSNMAISSHEEIPAWGAASGDLTFIITRHRNAYIASCRARGGKGPVEWIGFEFRSLLTAKRACRVRALLKR